MTSPNFRAMRPVLITGCSSGIGHCAALSLHRLGYPVVASARRAEDVAALHAQGLEAVRLDLDDESSIDEGLAEALECTGGRLYGLFNNGGFGQPGAVEDVPTQALRDQFQTLVFGWHHLTRQVIPLMRKQGEGRIVQNSSVLGFAVMPYRGAYSGAKFAIEGLSDALRLELAGSNVFVSLIEPGPILSRFRANALVRLRDQIPLETSHHADQYRAALARLQTEGPAQPFTLGPEAVVERLVHALEARRPKARYFVTFPTYLFWYLKRVLPQSALDRLMLAASGGGRH